MRAPSARISVIIAAHNYAHFLPDALQSVVAQSDPDWECLVIDDGSTDETRAVTESFSVSDRRISYHFQENRGLASARNRGMSLAKGRYIQFLDADDWIDERKFAGQIAFLERHPEIQICFTNFRLVDGQTGRPLEGWDRNQLVRIEQTPIEAFLFGWERGVSLPIHAAMFRRNLWPGSAPFAENLPAKVDWLMWIDAAVGGARFHFLDEEWAFYRLHGGNMHRTANLDMQVAFLKAASMALEIIPPALRPAFVESTFHHIREYQSFQARLAGLTEAAPAKAPVVSIEGNKSSLLDAVVSSRILFELYLGLDLPTRERFGEPRSQDAEDFLEWTWRRDPGEGRLPPFLRCLHRVRIDLTEAFPDPEGADRNAFLEWARGSGAREAGYDPALVDGGLRAVRGARREEK